MIIDYVNYKGGTNNLCIIHESYGKYGEWTGITARSTKGLDVALRNFKRTYKRIYGKSLED